jgi:hypothetical protein
LADVTLAYDGSGNTKFSFSYPPGYQQVISNDFETNKNQEPAVEEKTENIITKPGHHNQYTGFEVMDVCRQIVSPDATPASTWFRGNTFKYLARAGWKNAAKELEDLKKAQEYLRLEIERVTKRDELMAANLEEIVDDEMLKAATTGVPWGRDYTPPKEDPWSAYIIKCPQCEVGLEPVSPVGLECPNGHGSRFHGIWMSQPAEEAQIECPICATKFGVNSGGCPQGHGKFVKDGKYWSFHFDSKEDRHAYFNPENAQHECPICEAKFGANGVCPNGHGYFEKDGQFWMASAGKRDEAIIEQKLLDTIAFCPKCGGSLGQVKLPKVVMEKYCLRNADSAIRVIDGRLSIHTTDIFK